MKLIHRIRFFSVFFSLVAFQSAALAGQEDGSDAISYQVPRYTDSRLFFTRKLKSLPHGFKEDGEFYSIQHSRFIGDDIEYKFKKHNLRALISPAAFRNKCTENKTVKIALSFSLLKGKLSKLARQKGQLEKEEFFTQYFQEVELFKKFVRGFEDSTQKNTERSDEGSVRAGNGKKKGEGGDKKKEYVIKKILDQIDKISVEPGKTDEKKKVDLNKSDEARFELFEQQSKEIEAFLRAKYKKSECQAVEPGDSISLIINRLRLPALNSVLKISRLKDDVAAVVDVDSGSLKKTPVIVKYVRDVENFSTMDFGDLTVFSDSSWSGLVPPYFRFRLIDVATDDNDDVKNFLTRSATVVSKLSTVAVDPAIAPLVQVGIEGAKMLVGNDENSPIIDYEFQLYTKQMIDRSGSDNYLGQLKPGLAVLFARDADVRSDEKDIQAFWNQDFFVDVETGFVFWIENTENKQTVKIVNSPTIIATISTAELGIPSIIADRTRELQEKLVRSNDGMVSQDLEHIGEQMKNALNIHSARLKLRRYPSDSVACEAYRVYQSKEVEKVTLEQKMMLLRTINEYFMRDELLPDLSKKGRLPKSCRDATTSQNLLR